MRLFCCAQYSGFRGQSNPCDPWSKAEIRKLRRFHRFLNSTRAEPWTPCRATPRAQLLRRLGGNFNGILFKTRPSRPKPVAARLYASTAPGPGHRPGRRCTVFEGAHQSRKVRILENLDDSFEDAHPFPRCATIWYASSRRKQRGWVFRRRRWPRMAAGSRRRLDWPGSFIQPARRAKLGLALRGPDTFFIDRSLRQSAGT